MHTFRWMMGLVLTSTAMGSAALTIGSLRGPVWLQQKLDLSVPVQLEPGAPPDALCASAEVSFGDSMVDRSQVQVQAEKAAAPDAWNLRISTGIAVNEPVVTLVLQVGCEQKLVRQYVLLPDLPMQDDAAARRPMLLADPVPPPLAPAPNQGSGPVETAPSGALPPTPAVTAPVASAPPTAAVARPKSKPRLRLELQAPAPRRTPPPPAPAPAPAPSGSHLALEPLQALGEQVRKLEEATPPPPAEEAVSPQDERMRQLQGDIQLLLKQAAENDAKLVALRVRMEQAESERATLASALGVGVVLLLLAAAVALWMYRRQRTVLTDQDLDLDSDPEAKDLIVDFNPVDADHWEPPAQPVRPPSATLPQ